MNSNVKEFQDARPTKSKTLATLSTSLKPLGHGQWHPLTPFARHTPGSYVFQQTCQTIILSIARTFEQKEDCPYWPTTTQIVPLYGDRPRISLACRKTDLLMTKRWCSALGRQILITITSSYMMRDLNWLLQVINWSRVAMRVLIITPM